MPNPLPNQITVKELKERLADVPDDSVIWVYAGHSQGKLTLKAQAEWSSTVHGGEGHIVFLAASLDVGGSGQAQ